MAKNFVMNSIEVLKSPLFNPYDKTIFSLLMVHYPAYATQKTLAKWAGMSERQVRRCIKKLCLAGEVTIFRSPQRRNNIYAVAKKGGLSTEYVRENGLTNRPISPPQPAYQSGDTGLSVLCIPDSQSSYLYSPELDSS